MLLPITLTAAAAAALLHVWLSVRVSQVRRTTGIELGDGGSEPLTRRMRAHANYAENAPFFLVLLLLLELSGAGQPWLWVAVTLFFVARLAHLFGMDRNPPSALRMVGTAGSWTLLLLLAGWAIVLSYGRFAEAPARGEAPLIVG